MRRRKSKQSNKLRLRDENDKLFALIIRFRDGGVCQRCGSRKKLSAHHIFGRDYSVRWDLKNGVLLCFTCHILTAHSKNIKRANDFNDWVRDYLGEDYERLRLKSRKIVNFNLEFVQKNNKRLRREFKHFVGINYGDFQKNRKML